MDIILITGIILSFFQDGQPAQTRLCSFQDKHLKELSIVMDGGAPIFIMVGLIQRVITAPLASFLHRQAPLVNKTGSPIPDGAACNFLSMRQM